MACRAVPAEMNSGVFYGIASAVLPPLWLAALLYLGAGLGLLMVLGARWVFTTDAPIALPTARDWTWIGAAIGLGGVVGPIALMYGLTLTTAASASLLLNLEAVLTALLAWFLFKENFDRRIALGMLVIVAGATLLAVTPSSSQLLVAVACLCWALDNNLTRKVSGSDAVFLAALKGLVAGSVSASLAWALGIPMPPFPSIASAAAVGFLGYGVSLVLFILALRHLGTARAGAYFSVAPFFGAVLAVLAGQDAMTWPLVAAATLMGLGVWLHISEHHAHEHRHEPLLHTHAHAHDEHHRHAHHDEWNGAEPHVHQHAHAALKHSHPHYPDVHHRHLHR